MGPGLKNKDSFDWVENETFPGLKCMQKHRSAWPFRGARVCEELLAEGWGCMWYSCVLRPVHTSSRELTLSSCPPRCSVRSGWQLEISHGNIHTRDMDRGCSPRKSFVKHSLVHTENWGALPLRWLQKPTCQKSARWRCYGWRCSRKVTSGWKFRSLSFGNPEVPASLPTPFPGKMEMPHLKGGKHPFIIRIKSITNENLLYSLGNSTHCPVVT